MKTKRLLLALGLLLVLQFLHLDLQAQYHYSGFRTPRYRHLRVDPIAMARKKPFQRYGVGLTYVPISGTFTYKPIDDLGNIDTGSTVNIKGWGAGVAYSIIIPCARTGEKTLLAAHIGLNANFYLYNVDSISIRKVTTFSDATYSYSGPGVSFVIGLPLGLDLLTGGEATLDRADRFSFVVGAGFFPMATIGGVNESGGVYLKVPPYVKAEVGFHAGINWKVRAMYLSKSPISFVNDGQSIFEDGTLQAELKAKDQFMISLVVQPFSFGWE